MDLVTTPEIKDVYSWEVNGFLPSFVEMAKMLSKFRHTSGSTKKIYDDKVWLHDPLLRYEHIRQNDYGNDSKEVHVTNLFTCDSEWIPVENLTKVKRAIARQGKWPGRPSPVRLPPRRRHRW